MSRFIEQPQVILYTTNNCPYSWETREHLRERGVDFEELFVDESELAAQVLHQMVGDMVVPVTVVIHPEQAETVIVGFDRQRLDAALGVL